MSYFAKAYFLNKAKNITFANRTAMTKRVFSLIGKMSVWHNVEIIYKKFFLVFF